MWTVLFTRNTPANTVVVDVIAPEFTSATAATVVTGIATSTVVYDADATDNDGVADTNITYSLEADVEYNNKFTIDSDTGEVRYVSAPTDEGEDTITITATDTAGNQTSKSVTVVVNNRPVAVITSDAQGETATSDVTFTFAFSEDASFFDANDIAITGGVKGAFSTINDGTYTLVVTPDADTDNGLITVNVPAGVVAGDTTGVYNGASTQFEQAYDTQAPTVSAIAISGAEADGTTAKTEPLVAGDHILVTVTMSEATTVTGTPTYTLDVGDGSKTATYVSNSDTDTLVFSYTVEADDLVNVDEVTGAATAFKLNGATLADELGNTVSEVTTIIVEELYSNNDLPDSITVTAAGDALDGYPATNLVNENTGGHVTERYLGTKNGDGEVTATLTYSASLEAAGMRIYWRSDVNDAGSRQPGSFEIHFYDDSADETAASVETFDSLTWVESSTANLYYADLVFSDSQTFEQLDLVATSNDDIYVYYAEVRLFTAEAIDHVDTEASFSNIVAVDDALSTLSGTTGNDLFDFGPEDVGIGNTYTITDFSIADGDALDLSDLLTGESSANIDDYITFSDSDGDTTLVIDTDGIGGDTDLTIALENTTLTSLTDLINDSNLIIG